MGFRDCFHVLKSLIPNFKRKFRRQSEPSENQRPLLLHLYRDQDDPAESSTYYTGKFTKSETSLVIPAASYRTHQRPLAIRVPLPYHSAPSSPLSDFSSVSSTAFTMNSRPPSLPPRAPPPSIVEPDQAQPHPTPTLSLHPYDLPLNRAPPNTPTHRETLIRHRTTVLVTNTPLHHHSLPSQLKPENVVSISPHVVIAVEHIVSDTSNTPGVTRRTPARIVKARQMLAEELYKLEQEKEEEDEVRLVDPKWGFELNSSTGTGGGCGTGTMAGTGDGVGNRGRRNSGCAADRDVGDRKSVRERGSRAGMAAGLEVVREED